MSKKLFGSLGSRPLDLSLLLLMVSIVGCANVLWSVLETRPPYWDMGNHLFHSLVYSWYLETGEAWQFVTSYGYYPPLVYWATTPFYALVDPSVSVAVASINVVFLPVLVFGMYKLGSHLWSRRVGLLSALFMLCTPYIASTGKEYTLDVPLTAMAALSLYLLLRTEGFGRAGYSAWFGAAFGLGMLTRWTYLLVLFAPLLFVGGRAAWAAYGRGSWAPVRNAALAGAAAFAVCGYWYAGHFERLQADFAQNNTGVAPSEGDPVVGTAASNFYYLKTLLNEQLYLVPFVLLVVGLAVCALRRDVLRRNAGLLVYVAGIYLLFSLLANKNPRYTMPMLVGIVPLCLYWFDLVRWRWARASLSAAIVLYSVVVFLLVSFGSWKLPEEARFEAAGLGPVTLYSEVGHLSGEPSGETWHLQEMVRAVVEDPAAPKTLSYSGPDTVWFNSEALRYYSTLHGIDFSMNVTNRGRYDIANPDETSRYIAVREDASGTQPPDSGVRVGRWVLPDGSHLSLYRRKL